MLYEFIARKQNFYWEKNKQAIVDNFLSHIWTICHTVIHWEWVGYKGSIYDNLSPKKVINNFYGGI